MTSHRDRLRETARVIAEYRRLDAPARAALKQERKDRMPSGPTKLKTVGIAPKTITAAALPLVAGVVLLLVDKLVPGAAIDDTLWWTLLASSPALGLGTYGAPAAPALPAHARESRVRSQAGQGLIELVVVVLVILILVFVLLRVA
jgi:hypothetical protein